MNAITELHARIDAINAPLVEETARRGKPITCQGKGCCACCYEPVYCSSAEVHHLLESLTDEQKTRVTARLSLALEKVRASGLFDKDMPPVMEWLALQVSCPLLEGSKCMVYERRPVSCRSHMACGPANWCVENREHQIYPMAEEISKACGQAIIETHMKLNGKLIQFDNLLALLEYKLLGEYHETASAQKIVLEEEAL
jgi:Fe-S-cluster containining protein